MQSVTATFRDGRIELTESVDWADGTEVQVTPVEAADKCPLAAWPRGFFDRLREQWGEEPFDRPPRERIGMRSLTVFMLVIVCGLWGCGSTSSVRSSRSQALDEGVMLYSVYWEGKLVYAFAVSKEMDVTLTNEPSHEPASKGIHWCHVMRDGLWFNGRKVAIPDKSNVFAIRLDGSIVAVELTDNQREHLAEEFGRIVDDGVNAKFLAALQN